MEPSNPPPLAELMRLGAAAIHAGRFEDALNHFQEAATSGNDAAAYSNLAMVLASMGRFREAADASEHAAVLRPDVPELQSNLGNALQLAGQIDDAVEAYRRALQLRRNFPDAQTNLAHALTTLGSFDEAIALLEKVLSHRPDSVAGLINLGIAWLGNGDLDAAINTLRQALDLQPDSPETHANLSLALKDAGQLDDAIHHARRSLAIHPDIKVADSLLMLIQYHPGFDSYAIATEHRDWFTRYIEGRFHPQTSHSNHRSLDRRLRIGYVSPDFRAHPVGYNILPLLQHHDRSRFEIFCYSNVTRCDAVTDRLREAADHWRNIRALDDSRAVKMIQGDKIDILIDLALHTGENRLPLFALKPAPVQINFAGYPGITGLPAIDYRFTDPYLHPAHDGESSNFDVPIRLPHSFWCYQPLGTEPPVNPLPAQAAGFVTFGCLNNFCKVSNAALQLWANVLTAIPESRLILLAKTGSHRQRTKDFLATLGVNPGRVDFVSPCERTAYLQTYHRVDIGLDTFPYNGHTTTLDALWMGVPVITLVGQSAVGRAGLSHVSNLGLQHFAVPDVQAFASFAIDVARDLPTLAELRAGLRQRMTGSKLTDAKAFAGEIESACRTAWRKWANGAAI